MTEPTQLQLSSRISARPVQWLLVGTLLLLNLPTLAADAVTTAKKASSTSDAKVAQEVKPKPHNVTPEEEREVKHIGPPTPPIKDSEDLIKSNKKAKKLKARKASSNEPAPISDAATKQ
jgi:hypothetical protein